MASRKLKFALFGNIYQSRKSANIQKILACLDEHDAEVRVDARPSDALALAVRANAPVYVEDDVMNRAGTVSYHEDQKTEDEYARFDEFAHTVSPDDF